MWENIVERVMPRHDNMAHALCKLDNQDYRHITGMCNTYCFPTATVVRLTRPIVINNLVIPVTSKEMCLKLSKINMSCFYGV